METNKTALTRIPDAWEFWGAQRQAVAHDDTRGRAGYAHDYYDEEEAEEPPRYHCRHIFSGGRRCGSPALRREPFCYYHHTTRKPVQDPGARKRRRKAFVLPVLEDRSSVRQAIDAVIARIAANEIDLRRAGLLLYGLQTAGRHMPKERAKPEDKSDVPGPYVEETVVDAQHGVLAPVAEIGSLEHHVKGSAERMLEELERDFGKVPVQT